LVASLQARRDELAEATVTRVAGIADPRDTSEPAYLNGFRPTVIVALEYAIKVIGNEEPSSPPIPAAILVQTRLAAQAGVSLDTVLRRYFAGYTLLTNFIVEEVAGGERFAPQESKELLRTGAEFFDRMVAAITDEYAQVKPDPPATSEQRDAERIERLLAGELVNTGELPYHFNGCHLGLIASGEQAADAVQVLATDLDCQRLLVVRDDHRVWVWLGARRQIEPTEIEDRVGEDWPSETRLAIGEPSAGLAGWRLTHRQARAALTVVERGVTPVARYADVALVASMLQDDLLVTSLRELFLEPLADERDGGKTLRRTLRAFFVADRNVSSAAATLGVKRHTVTSRLRILEGKLGRPLSSFATEIDAALQLEPFSHSQSQ
jgi:hypothetical protein